MIWDRVALGKGPWRHAALPRRGCPVKQPPP